MSEEKTITITVRRYKDLLRAEALLAYLRAVGVDNWEGYSEAIRMLEEEDSDVQ